MINKDKISFVKSFKNNFYQDGLIDPLVVGSPSFLSIIHDKAKKSDTDTPQNFADLPAQRSGYLIKTQPKWQTQLVNQDTGELYYSSDLKSCVGRKYKAVDKFVAIYSAPYQRKEVSLLFHTLTAVNLSNYAGIKPFIEAVKYRYEQVNRPLLGYIWVLEVSKNFHVHYHLATAVNRLEVKRIPKPLKLDGLWGARTGVEFVKGEVGQYMQKKALGGYMSKHARLWEKYQVRRGYDASDLKVMRQYGKSSVYNLCENSYNNNTKSNTFALHET